MVIKNWKLYLESNNELDLVKDILTEIEDSFGVSIEYDTNDVNWFLITDIININVDPSKNDEMVKFLVRICQKIEEMTEQKCEFKLTFRPMPKANALSGPLGKINISRDYVVLYGAGQVDSDNGVSYDYHFPQLKRQISDFKFIGGSIWINKELPNTGETIQDMLNY